MGSTIDLINEDEEEPVEELTSWNCPQCTYQNTPFFLVCGFCGLERPSISSTPTAAAEYTSPAPKPPTAAPAPSPRLNNNTSWTCQMCTLVNGSTTPACDACGAPWVVAEDDNKAEPSTSYRRPRKPAPTLAGSHNEPGVYTLDCGCCMPLQDAKSVLNRTIAQLPSSHGVPALLQLFRCPGGISGGKCRRYVSHRDLEALVGAQTAATIDRYFYSTATQAFSPSSTAAASRNEVESERHCTELASRIAELHSAVVASTGEAAGSSNAQMQEGKRKCSAGSKKGGGRAGRGNGVGYGGSGSDHGAYYYSGTGYGGTDDRAARQGLEAAAAQRQHRVDERITAALQAVRSALTDVLHAEEDLTFISISPVGWLPVGAVAVLLGSPLAACLRLLLCNDSLMDITGRKELYAEALQLLTTLASKQELIPLLLKPADGDILAEFSKYRSSGAEQQSPPRKKSKSVQKQDGDSGSLSGLDQSCWKALQSFQMQCQLFLQNAEALANEGSEEDVGNVGTVIFVQETCKAVDEAVEAWKAFTKASAAATAPPPAAATATPAQQNGTTYTPSAAQKQHYVESLQPFSFRMIDIVDGGEYYFRQYLNQPIPGGNARLRRLTKEIPTLSGNLPIDWDSSILLAVDTNRLDVLRAVIFPPKETPYAHGAFFFDIFLPPEYPNKPPMVQFMTTGGGKIRFNPNLYDNGKVCLSLLGTWSGPSWDPATSTLLQVLISIQGMILGEKQPYGNEPGWERQLHTAHGKKFSAQYNRTQQYNTTQYSILPALKGQMPRGFDEAVKLHFKLKAEEVKMQVRLWSSSAQAAVVSAQQNRGGGGRGNGHEHDVPYLQGGYLPGSNPNRAEKYAKAMKEAASAVITALDGL